MLNVLASTSAMHIPFPNGIVPFRVHSHFGGPNGAGHSGWESMEKGGDIFDQVAIL